MLIDAYGRMLVSSNQIALLNRTSVVSDRSKGLLTLALTELGIFRQLGCLASAIKMPSKRSGFASFRTHAENNSGTNKAIISAI